MAKRTRADGAPAAPPKPKRRPRSPDAASATYALPVTVEGDAPWPPYLYVKRHAEAGTGPPRAAFVSGLPPTWRPVQDVVAAVFGVVGGVDTVIVHKDEVRGVEREGWWDGGGRRANWLADDDRLFSPLSPPHHPQLALCHSLLRIPLLPDRAAGPGQGGRPPGGQPAAA